MASLWTKFSDELESLFLSLASLWIFFFSEQARRLIRKPYNRPTAASTIYVLKPFRAAESPWVHGREKVADGNEDDEEARISSKGSLRSILLK